MSALRVTCPHCAAAEGSECQTKSGRTTKPHSSRWDHHRHRIRSDRYIVRVKRTDDHTGVIAGEEYLAETYWLDPQKVTLLSRIPDGFDPSCNEYRSGVAWVRWADSSPETDDAA